MLAAEKLREVDPAGKGLEVVAVYQASRRGETRAAITIIHGQAPASPEVFIGTITGNQQSLMKSKILLQGLFSRGTVEQLVHAADRSLFLWSQDWKTKMH